jgi:pyruvate dehydrogenase E2 component (dihydrolipoamide acetyltransferase)
MFGVEQFTAIINPPDACILAIGSIRQEPGVVDGHIKVVNKMKVTLSSDHRVVDGALGGSFVKRVAEYLEAFDANREY